MAPKKKIFANSEDKWDYIIALIVITIFSVFTYQFLFKTTEEVTIYSATEVDKTQIGSTTYQTTTIQAEDAYESDVKTAVVVSDFNKDKSVATDSIPKHITDDNENRSLFKTPKKADGSSAATLLEKEEEEKVKEEESIEVEVEKTPKIKTVKPAVTNKIEPATTNKNLNCVVIVGVFQTVANKTTVIEKLKSLGYAHTNGILREGLNYVGVPVACDNKQERQKLLSELNQIFGINSWIKKI